MNPRFLILTGATRLDLYTRCEVRSASYSRGRGFSTFCFAQSRPLLLSNTLSDLTRASSPGMKMRGGGDRSERGSSSIQIQIEVGGNPMSSPEIAQEESSQTQINGGGSFACKTCDRSFLSFQALGGHRTSHGKRKTWCPKPHKDSGKPKMHSCAICGAEFSLGQSLGGHMRKHRILPMNDALKHESSSSSSSSFEATSVVNGSSNIDNVREAMSFDLNLTPSENEMQHPPS